MRVQENFCDVLLPLPFDNGFSYDALDFDVEIGDIVKVPFGKKTLFGVVVKKFSKQEFLAKNKLDLAKIRPIIAKNPFLKLEINIVKFIDKISSYNMAPKGLVLKAFIGFLNSDKVKDDKIAQSCLVQEIDVEKINLKKLSLRQNEVANEIIEGEVGEVSLIDGVTGSGKTEVYFKIIAEILKKSQGQILIMLPEIALTSQILERFEKVFGFKAALWHSKITKKTKREIFYGIAKGTVRVVIGARSSLLLPFKNLQLIVVDEEHDSSYKQGEIFNFSARDMAILKSFLDGFKVVLGSATPSLESFYNAKKLKKYRYFALDEKFNEKENQVNIIDLKREKLDKGTYISQKLREELAQNFAKKHQSLLFLNRRGYSPVVLCKACGEKVNCLDCSSYLVHHKSLKKLTCHYCGYEEKFNPNCRKCGEEKSMINLGVGVEKIKEEVEKTFPQARVALVTSDNLSNFKEAKELVEKISNNEIDIIIGTQMIAKGYDFENLTLVGIVDADSGFFSSDLKASERSFQLLSQVFGRAGRARHQGKVFVQTYSPDNFILKKLIANDKDGFYNFELENRKVANLPPFTKMANIVVSSLKGDIALKAANEIVRNVPFNDSIEVFGPAESALFRLKNRYYYNVFLKVEKKINLQKLIFDITNEVDFLNNINVKIDIDP